MRINGVVLCEERSCFSSPPPSQSGKVGVKAVQTITVGNNGYRADLQAAALARFQKLTRVTPKAVKA